MSGKPLLNVKVTNNESEHSESEPLSFKELFERLTGKNISLCPKCKVGHMVAFENLVPDRKQQYLNTS